MTSSSARCAMPGNAEGPDALVDTSVAVAIVVADHEHHDATLEALSGRRLGLCGHAGFETFSVLTRLPQPLRRTPAAVARILHGNFPRSRFLSAHAAQGLLDELPRLAIAGGSVYDALVAACAREHGIVLVTRDRRALDTYRALEIEIESLP